MPSLSILSTTGSAGTWWSWHLAWALAEQGLDVIWVEAEGAEWTPKLLNPFQNDDWEAERLPSLLHVARGDEGVPPLALPDLEAVPTLRILPGWPTHRPGRLEAEHIDAYLARWIRAQDAWVVVSLSRPWLNPWTQVLQESRATITVASPNRESVRDLRALGRALQGRLPEHRRYAFIDQPEDRYKRKDWDYWRRRVPGAFRYGWLGAADVSDATPINDTPWCVGTCLYRPQARDLPLPVFRLPPASGGHGVSDAGVIEARREWTRVLRGVGEVMGVEFEATPIEQTPAPATSIVRFVRPRSARPERKLDEEPGLPGFLTEEPEGTMPLAQALAGSGCTVLIGEPGIGKSYELGQLPETIPLGNLQPSDLRGFLDQSRGRVVLDGVDEWPGNLQTLILTLQEWLKARSPLTDLVVAGRAGAQMDRLTKFLEDRYRPENTRQFVLLPLKRSDVAAFVHDAEAFLTEIEALDLAHLAARPVTLELLLRLPNPLPGDRLEVYRRGLDALVRYQTTREDHPDPEKAMKAAKRIAWVAVLRKQVRARVGAGGELDTAEIRHWFPDLDQRAYDVAVASPLFDHGVFVHPTYAEYLAACHAIEEQIPVPTLMQWLFSTSGILYEHLAGTASWLVAMSAEVAERFVRRDPGRLLTQRAHVHPDSRATWLEALIEAKKLGAVRFWQQSMRELVNPDDPRILSQARTMVREADLELAIAGVRLLTLHGDLETLAVLAKDPAGNIDVRTWAIYGLRDLKATGALKSLRSWLSVDPPGDQDGGFRGALIEALWPEQLSAIEAIRRLPRPKGEVDFNYGYFLKRQAHALVEDLDEPGIAESLLWLSQHRGFEHDGFMWQKWPFEVPLLQRAWALARDPNVAEALGRLLATWVDSEGDDRIERVEVDWHDADLTRSILVLRSLLTSLPPNTAEGRWWYSLSHSDLVPSFEVLVDQAEQAAVDEPGLAGRWLNLARVWGWPPERRERVARLAHLAPGIEKELESRTRPPIPWIPPSEKEPPPTPQLEKIQRLIDQATTDPRWWVALSSLLDLDRSRRKTWWEALSERDQARVREIALTFFVGHPWDREACLGDWRYRETARDTWRWLPPEIDLGEALDFWAPALLPHTRPGDDVRTHILRVRLGERLPTEARHALELDSDAADIVVRWLGPWWDADLTARAKALLEIPRPTEEGTQADQRRLHLDISQGRLLEALLEMPETRETFWRWGLEHLPAEWLARCLLTADAHRLWDQARSRFFDDDAFARALAPTLVDDRQHAGWWSSLPSDEIARVHIRLVRLFPFVERPDDGRVLHIVETPELVRRLGFALRDHFIRNGQVEAITRLVHELGWAQSWIIAAERVRANQQAEDALPHFTIEAIARLTPRLTTAADLRTLVVDTLYAIQHHDLDGERSVYRSFFEDGLKRRTGEVEACQLLAKLLELRLDRRIKPTVIDLETQTHGGDNRADFIVTAPADGGGLLRVKIECKWANHPKVATALKEQLGAYLTQDTAAAGIYLVLWWHPNIEVQAGDPINARWRDRPEPLETLLKEQAGDLALPPDRLSVEPVILRLKRSIVHHR